MQENPANVAFSCLGKSGAKFTCRVGLPIRPRSEGGGVLLQRVGGGLGGGGMAYLSTVYLELLLGAFQLL